MRSSYSFVVKIVLVLCFIFVLSKSTSSSFSYCETSDNEFNENNATEYYSKKKADIEEAWSLAKTIAFRSSDLWKLDNYGNVILSSSYTISSPLAFKALVKKSKEGNIRFEATQEEYYGENDEDNFAHALKYKAENMEQDFILSLIEIALKGHVTNDNGESYCWCPSSIHQDLFLRNERARTWHRNLFANDCKYGMAGHRNIFQQMNVGLKDIRNYKDNILDGLDQVNDFMYIHNYQPQCSDVVKLVNSGSDDSEITKEINNNWGLPIISSFIDDDDLKIRNNLVSTSISKPKPKQSLFKQNIPQALSEDDWPSLSESFSTGKNKK